MQCGLNIQGPAAFLRCSAPNGTYVATTTSTIACSEKITGFTNTASDSRLCGLGVWWCLECSRRGNRPFRKPAAAVITQLGAFSLQFRSRSGCVFVARWRSGLTIGVPAPSQSHPRLYERVLQKKRYNFIWQRRDATPERLLCVFHVYVYRRARTRGALNASCLLLRGYKFYDGLVFISKRVFAPNGAMAMRWRRSFRAIILLDHKILLSCTCMCMDRKNCNKSNTCLLLRYICKGWSNKRFCCLGAVQWRGSSLDFNVRELITIL